MGVAPPWTWQVVGVGDFDGNGLSDVLLQNQTTGEVGTWLLQSGGTPNGWKSMGTAPVSTWKIVSVGDFDGNGLSDVLLENQSSGEVGAWLLHSGSHQRLEEHGHGPSSDVESDWRGRLRRQRPLRRVAAKPNHGRGGRMAPPKRQRRQRLEEHGQRPVSTWKVVPGEVAALQAASVVTDPESDVASLTQSDLQPIVDEAIARWAAAGLDAATVARLTQVQFVISDLPGSYLGEAEGNLVYLDSNAAGHGWFVDPTPALDEEFAADREPRPIAGRRSAGRRSD